MWLTPKIRVESRTLTENWQVTEKSAYKGDAQCYGIVILLLIFYILHTTGHGGESKKKQSKDINRITLICILKQADYLSGGNNSFTFPFTL